MTTDTVSVGTAPAVPAAQPASPVQEQPRRSTAREINAGIRYTAFSVYARRDGLTSSTGAAVDELTGWQESLAENDVDVRGFYDVSGLRTGADLMIWWHGPTADSLQSAARSFRRTGAGQTLVPAWSAYGLHRPAEFNKGHVPAFLAGAAAQTWVAVYPFVRSYEWYLLPDAERRSMLVEHGVMGREYDQVLSNTVAAFALGDYEWLLALEAEDLHDIVDLMRHLRSSRARMHVREEVPFYTGRRIDAAEAVEVIR